MISTFTLHLQQNKDRHVTFSMRENPELNSHVLDVSAWQTGNPQGDVDEQVSSSVHGHILFSPGQLENLRAVVDAYLQEVDRKHESGDTDPVGEVSSEKFAGIGSSLYEQPEYEEETGCMCEPHQSCQFCQAS